MPSDDFAVTIVYSNQIIWSHMQANHTGIMQLFLTFS